ncbi:MFS-type efflux pump MSMEG_3705-like [Haliotis rufescens]|uniref:MFS-type efflux pump MSMEG_3705-like n=1 Tax=Haliotis rufescens TaxID=6454 RepID=UPI00201EEBFF|nr:MFS-type efflux pump MSMEG_3705-like [Haliotis rufescens]XP_048245361.1 MFS-type efflux pump MSMEG_3705-like [Haliotis rufescens]XP_048245362.1 MFS-type efflux pump MSMEG_3705-like [Haliotis rufescens]XP_048245363.1 MFS-type efflux pump MSMEG_3705-like [Haliotis rufescens]XP_048245364.1 MFS-type efflux pump MSMEG_3705-like [Haliotis rufescens]
MDEGHRWWKDVRPYSMYVLVLVLLAYLLNQLDRYMLAITAKPMAQEIRYGDQACMVNTTFTTAAVVGVKCNGTTSGDCTSIHSQNGSAVCKWDYNGQGYEYQLVAGPVFILIYTFMGIFIGFAADMYNRKILLAICLIFWSVMTLLTGAINEYWQLVILRFGLGMGEAGCTPFAASLLTDYFSASVRGLALGVYNWGIYMGYSLSYAIGNFITLANINGQGWRWAFYISGIPGLILGVLIIITLKEPARHVVQPANEQGGLIQSERPSILQKLGKTLKPFLSPSLIMLCVAGSIRNAAGYVWAYNTQPYFVMIGQTKEQIGTYMSWIPLVSGSIGVVVGGFISDRVVKKRGLYARVLILVASQIIAAPFAAGTLFLNPPGAFISQIPTYIIGEMWVGVTLAVLVELVPSNVRAGAVAVYLFIISNVGGNVPLLVPYIQSSFEARGFTKVQALRGSLYILYPGLYVLGSLLFLLTMFVVKRDQRRVQGYEELDGNNSDKES